jgi:hypothetical protein
MMYQNESLPWSFEVEELLLKWCTDCSDRAVLHARQAERKQWRFRMISIPSLIIPIAMSSFSQLYSACNNYEARIVNSLGYLISGSLAGVSAFFNYGQQYAQHAQYEIMYDELRTEMECIMAKPALYRGHADVVLMDVRRKYDALNKGSPDL